MSGRISFIGAGPGSADLITMRGARRLAEADVVLWSASQVAPECVWEHARTDAEMVDSSRLRHEEAVELFRRAERDRLRVVRMHAGDPSLWGDVRQLHDACARMELQVEVVPGVAPFSAAAASVGRELTNPEVARSVVLARLDGGQAPMPDGAKVRELARHGTTMAVSLAAARVAQLAEELREGGYPEDTPVLVAYKISLPDELVLRTTLGELEGTVKKHKLWRNALFLVGQAVAEGRSRSHGAGRTGSQRRSPDPRGPRGGSPARKPAGVPEQRFGTRETGPSESDVAWWAVRDWQDSARQDSARQDSARGGTRVASRSSAARQVEERAQDDLFAGATGDDVGSGRIAEVVNLSVVQPPVESEVDSDGSAVVEASGAGAGKTRESVPETSAESTEDPAGSAATGATRSAKSAKAAEKTAGTGEAESAGAAGSAKAERANAESAGAGSAGVGNSAKSAQKPAGAKAAKGASKRKSATTKQNQRAGQSGRNQATGPEPESGQE